MLGSPPYVGPRILNERLTSDSGTVASLIRELPWPNRKLGQEEAAVNSLDADRLAEHARWLDSAGAAGARLALAQGDLSGADLNGVRLAKADLTAVNLSRARLEYADLAGADLTGADLSNAVLTETSLIEAVLVGATLRGADLYRAVFVGANLQGADLTGADLHGADCDGADLAGAVLHRARCLNASFDGANLAGADLTRAYLAKASAAGAKLLGVDLREADAASFMLSDAHLDLAKVGGFAGIIGPPAAEVILVEAGALRRISIEQLVIELNRSGAKVSTWRLGERPEWISWRWADAG